MITQDTQENDYLILKYFVLISIVVALLQCALKFIIMIVQRKYVGDSALISDYCNIIPGSQMEEDILEQILEAKKLAEKISEEKQLLESHPFNTFTDDIQSELKQKYVTFRDQIKSDLEEENRKNFERYKEVEETVEILKNDLNDLKYVMMQIVSAIHPRIEEPAEDQQPKNLVENYVQTEGEYEIISEAIDTELPDYVLPLLKDCMKTVNDELQKAWVDSVMKSLKTLEQNHKDIESLLIANWDDIYSAFLDCSHITNQVMNLEKTVFGILLFLKKQTVDAHTVRDTLSFFNSKFQNFMHKNETQWEKSCSNLDGIFAQVQQAQLVLKESSTTFSDRSVAVAKVLTNAEYLMKDFVLVTDLTLRAVKISRTVKGLVSQLIGDVFNLSAKIDGSYCQKLNDLSEALQNPREKFFVLYKTTEDLHSLRELMRQAPYSSSPSKRQSTITLQAPDLGENQVDANGNTSDYQNIGQDSTKEFGDEYNPTKQFNQKYISNDRRIVERMMSIEEEPSSDSSSLLTLSEKFSNEKIQNEAENNVEVSRNEIKNNCLLVTPVEDTANLSISNGIK